MTEEGSFPRLVELIRQGTDDELGLHRVLVELMYEMSRIQELAIEELGMSCSNTREISLANAPSYD